MPCDDRSFACPRQSVHSEVALQVEDGLIFDVAHLVDFDWQQAAFPRLERRDVVIVRPDMHPNHFLPMVAVHPHVLDVVAPVRQGDSLPGLLIVSAP